MEGLSLRSLARDLGVSHAAPRRHFSDRAALISELATEGFRCSIEAMNAGSEAAGPDPVDRYRALGRAYVRFACERTALFRAMHHPEVRGFADAELRRAQKRYFATLREGVEAAKRAGWHSETDTDALVAFSTAAALGTAQLLADGQWRSMLGVAPSARDAMADAILDLIVQRDVAATIPPDACARPKTKAATKSKTKTKPSTKAKPRTKARRAS